MGENIYRIFDGVWNISLVGGCCVLLVILARLLLQKAPKWCSYLLWGIVIAVAVIVVLIVSLGSNPGGGQGGTDPVTSAVAILYLGEDSVWEVSIMMIIFICRLVCHTKKGGLI